MLAVHYGDMAEVTNITFRVEGASEKPHKLMESVGDPTLGIWVSDHDIMPEEQAKIPDVLENVLKIASEVNEGSKYIHIGLAGGRMPFRLSPALLISIAKVECTLEIEV